MNKLTNGEKLKRRRQLKDYSQEELARLVNVSQSTIQRLEKDGFKRPPVDIYNKLAKVLGVSEEYFNDNTELNHLEKHIQEFVLNPANGDFIEWAYLKWKEIQVENKILK